MQGFLLILESCNNVIIEHWVKSLAELLNVLKRKKRFIKTMPSCERPDLVR